MLFKQNNLCTSPAATLCSHSLDIDSVSAQGSGPSLANIWTRAGPAVGQSGEPGRK